MWVVAGTVAGLAGSVVGVGPVAWVEVVHMGWEWTEII